MLLLIIIHVTCLNIFYFVIFYFIKDEFFNDYYWVLKALKRLYNHFNLSYSLVILFNDDKALALTLLHVFKWRKFNRNIIHYALYI